MKKIEVTTVFKSMLADLYTPVAMYLRLRDRFRDTILLESADSHAGKQSYSFIGVNAIAGIEVTDLHEVEIKYPGQEAFKEKLPANRQFETVMDGFMQRFNFNPVKKPANVAQSLFGYLTHDALQLFTDARLQNGNASREAEIPLLRYRFYQYVIVMNHFKNELYICENRIEGLESNLNIVESAIRSRDVPQYPFSLAGDEVSDTSDEAYLEMVEKGIEKCQAGELSQIVLSRGFRRSFQGDEFNVYRALRNINPSPYMFYFDYGDYRLMGSSPESQILVNEGVATIHPIAGTFRRTGIDQEDQKLAKALKEDEKELDEHDMLVDLAQDDLRESCTDIEVSNYCQVQFFSHVIHLVSEVKGKVKSGVSPFALVTETFPAGTLSGAPKGRALELIDEYEGNSRGYYGGGIGLIGFDGNVSHAIIIRTFLSKNNQLYYRAGAGVTAKSKAKNELNEVHNKLSALTKAMEQASTSTYENLLTTVS